MWSRLRIFLLPIFGAIAAIVSFKISAPYESTLSRPGLSLADPEAQFTYGTQWGEVNRLAYGALICGLLCFGLTVGRRSWKYILLSTVIGTVVGAAVNYVTDSSADLIGLSLARTGAMGATSVAEMAWCVLVPLGISLTVALAVGLTMQRLRRAIIATFVAAVGSYVAHMAVGVLTIRYVTEQIGTSFTSLSNPSQLTLQSFIPVWRAEAIAAAVALGLTMVIADQFARAGTIRLLRGRNEWREWSLDHPVNRIGRSEGIEIPIRGFADVAPVHATVTRQGSNFILDAQGGPVFVDGVPCQQALLAHGSTIQIGAAILQFLGGSVRLPAFYAQPQAIQGYPGPYYPGVPQPMPAYPVPGPVGPAGPAVMPCPVQPQAAPADAVSPEPELTVALHPLFLLDTLGGRHSLSQGKYGIGRETDNDICLSYEPSVSRHHAEITVTDSGIEIVDLGSLNGTRINGEPVDGTGALRPGDVLEMGSARFTLAE